MPSFKDEILRMDNENILMLHYLKVPYHQWQYLTIFKNQRHLLELTDVRTETILPQLGGLNQLLIKQKTLTERCWRVAEELLADYAEAVGFRFCGRPKQQIDLQRLDNGSSANVVVDLHTNVSSLKRLSLFLQKQETPAGVSCTIDKQKLDGEFEKMSLMQDELEKQWVARFQMHGDKVAKWRLVITKSPFLRSVYLDDDNDADVKLSVPHFEPNIYGYADFLEYIVPYTDTRPEYLYEPHLTR